MKTKWERWVVKILKYAGGILLWMGIFIILGYYCIFDIGAAINGLLLKELNANLVQNLMGEVAYRDTRYYGCGGRLVYMYFVEYYDNPDDMYTTSGEKKTLTSLVDVATWRSAESNYKFDVAYVDSKYRYELRTNLDYYNIKAVKR